MQRIMRPLAEMGAEIRAREDKFPPLEIHGTRLRPIDYTLPVPSAQVKTCVLFAGLFAEGQTSVSEPVASRDHTEVALREFGAELSVLERKITVAGRPRLTGRELTVPSDLSSAAFFIVAALLVPGSQLTIRGVGLNPTRSALLDLLTGMGAKILIPTLESRNGELIGDIVVQYSDLKGGTVEGALTAALIDEIPVLAVLGAATEEGLTVRDAGELRVKETDRIRTVVENLRRLGVEAEERSDGMVIPGRQKFRGAAFDSFGDHRIAMAFAVAALRAEGESVIEGAEAASVSFPEFWSTLARIAHSD
jgi:3-phosphoshikimate 1-carboxyvinyltransferase